MIMLHPSKCTCKNCLLIVNNLQVHTKRSLVIFIIALCTIYTILIVTFYPQEYETPRRCSISCELIFTTGAARHRITVECRLKCFVLFKTYFAKDPFQFLRKRFLLAVELSKYRTLQQIKTDNF